MLKKAISNVFERKVTLLSARPIMGKMAFTSEVITEGLRNNKKILLVTLENDENYFLCHLISRISGLSIKDVSVFYYPCRESSKIYEKEIDSLKVIEAINYIRKSNLYISSNLFLERDIVDYLLEFDNEEKFDLIVINNLDLLIKKSKYLVSEIISMLRKLNSVLIWNGVLREVENKNDVPRLVDINNYDEIKDFIDSNIVLYRKIENGCDIIKIVDYMNDININMHYDKEFDRLKG